MLTHANLISEIRQVLAEWNTMMNDGDYHLSFLPLSHAVERVAGFYIPMSVGIKVYFGYGLLSAVEELQTIRPTIFIAVPNRESYDAQHYQSVWAAYDVPRHLWHFTKDQMAALLQKEGLTIKQVIPMKLDAYYVSLLSERYKSGGTLTLLGMIRAIWTGLKSNLKGKNKTNQSSLIFVVQK